MSLASRTADIVNKLPLAGRPVSPLTGRTVDKVAVWSHPHDLAVIKKAGRRRDSTINECIFSFDGNMRVGFKADRDNVPDPHGLVAAFDNELSALTQL